MSIGLLQSPFREVARREIASKGKGNSSWVIERSFEALAYALGMDAWRTYGGPEADTAGVLKKCYEAAQKLGYLTGYEMDVKGKTKTLDRSDLNPEKFRRMKGGRGRAETVGPNDLAAPLRPLGLPYAIARLSYAIGRFTIRYCRPISKHLRIIDGLG